MDEITLLKNRIEDLEGKINSLVKIDRYFFQRDIDIRDGQDIFIGGNSGTKIGQNALSKISVYGVNPTVQASAISAPSGGTTVDTQARAVTVLLIAALKAFGITG